MLARLLVLFLLTPVVELALLVQLDQLIGFWPTIGLILLTGITGSYLVKHEGLSVWRRFNERLHAGGLPGDELLDGVIILMAGALLITPGVLTDVVGFVGLFPLTRRPIRKLVMKRIRKAMDRGTISMQFGGFGTMNVDADEGAPIADEPPAQWGGRPSDMPRHRAETGEDGDRAA